MKILSITLALVLSLALLAFAFAHAQNAAAGRNHARAAAIRAASEARMDATAAFLPYVVLGVSVAFASGLVVLGVALVVRADVRREHEARVIERQIVLVVGEGTTRREMYKMIGDTYYD